MVAPVEENSLTTPEQLSDAVPLIPPTVLLHWVGPEMFVVTFEGQIIVGSAVSLTVIVNEQVAELLDPSVTL